MKGLSKGYIVKTGMQDRWTSGWVSGYEVPLCMRDL